MKPLSHPTLEELLGHLDGECSASEKLRLEAHLQQCWKCRSQSAELAQQIHRVTKALQQSAWPSPDHQDLAHRRLRSVLAREQARNHAAGSDSNEPIHRLHPARRLRAFLRQAQSLVAWPRLATAGLVAILLLLVGYGRLVPFRVTLPPPAVPLAAQTTHTLRFTAWDATQARKHAGRWPARGEMSLRLSRRQSQRLAADRSTLASAAATATPLSVQWISDAATGRFAIRWEERRGRIRFAAWQPRALPSIAYWYRQHHWSLRQNPRLAFPGATVVPILSEIGLEEEIFRWVASFTSHHRSPMHRVAALAAQPGASLRTHQQGALMSTCVSLSHAGQSVEDCVRADARTGDLLSEVILLASSQHELRLEIPWSAVRESPEALTELASFFPPGLASMDQDFASLLRSPRARPSWTTPALHPALLTALVAAEEAIEWLDNHAGPGVVLGLSLHADAVRVSGRVSTRDQLLLARSRMEQAVPSTLLDFDVLSGEDAPLPPPAEISPPIGDAASAPTALPFVDRAFPQWNAQDLREYCNRAVRISSQLMAEATALESLATRYPAELERQLSEPDRLRLRNIRRARAARSRANASVLRQHLAAIVPLEMLPSAEPEPYPVSASWQEDSRNTASQVRSLHEAVLALFAISPGNQPQSDRSLAGIMETLARLLAADPTDPGGVSARNQ